MARSAASYILMLDEQSSQAQNVLHTAKPQTARLLILTAHRHDTPPRNAKRRYSLEKSKELFKPFQILFYGSMKSNAKKINSDVKFLTATSGAIFDNDLKHFLGMVFAIKSVELYFLI
ncbi:MAG: hypothetical protein IKD10_09780 [Lentisphaeria bacterium]|nr:hypothetical protein [Lentisphaeria bacterium]